ncbi:MAG: NAD(P)-dependent glycerol-3-phosphate dehydrogenase [FCB group bacterium]|nr:NAD(P)-dependent glycerol-3-phosphate dehydrogenase [FCB group bacterium]
MKVTVMGAGTWGSALAQVLTDSGNEVFLWDINTAVIDQLKNQRTHANLPEFTLDPRIQVSTSLDGFPLDELVLVVVPSQVVRLALTNMQDIPQSAIVVCAAKGIENNTLMRMSQVIEEVKGIEPGRIGALSGPSHAEEVAKRMPTAVVSACVDIETARKVQAAFTTEYFRVYANSDIIGVELGASIKNVIAIAAGICDGSGFGDNTMAALITRGLAEITRLGKAMGAQPQTFFGLSGIGDLVVTSQSLLSRNRYVGKRIGQGDTLTDILNDMDMVAEGVKTTQSIHDLVQKLGIEMPICEKVWEVLFKEKSPRDAINELMGRDLVDEHQH